MNKTINGFTLIEMLFTMVILSLLIFIGVPSLIKVIENQQTKHFFQILNSDIFYIQNQALGTRQNIRIMFDEDYYILLHEQKAEEIKRFYPEHLTYKLDINNRISFSNSGTVINPTTFMFTDNNHSYKIVFPLGKGRHYIEKQ